MWKLHDFSIKGEVGWKGGSAGVARVMKAEDLNSMTKAHIKVE